MFKGWYGLNERAEALGHDFFEWSKLGVGPPTAPSWSDGRDLFLMSRGLKQFNTTDRVSLESDNRGSRSNVDFFDVLQARRSAQFFAGSIRLDDLADLLISALGVTAVAAVEGINQPLYASPSAGGLRSFDVYVIATKVENLRVGIYHFNPLLSGLEQLSEGLDRAALNEIFFGQPAPCDAAFHIVFVSVLQRLSAKYGEARAHRLALLDAGHACQNAILVAAASGVAACPYQAFHDDLLARLLNLDGVHEIPVHLMMGGR